MDSNPAHTSREDDNGCQLTPQAAEEPSRPQGSAPQADGEAGCHSNTQGKSSHIHYLEGFPNYPFSGGIDWFEWTALVRWAEPGPLTALAKRFEKAKQECQENRKPYVELLVPDFGVVRVSRMGINRGGERGQHFEYRLTVAGATIGISPRQPSDESSRRRKQRLPNFFVKQTGRDCLLMGAADVFEKAECLICALGGEPIEFKLSRADLCLDISNLDARELHELVRLEHFITDASNVRPQINYVTDEVTGFCAGRTPLYLTVYDKVAERLGKADQLYNRARNR